METVILLKCHVAFNVVRNVAARFVVLLYLSGCVDLFYTVKKCVLSSEWTQHKLLLKQALSYELSE